jgi:hypothetical protein
MADKYGRPFKIVQPDYSLGYVTCPADVKTNCEVIWSTDDPEPEPEPTPGQKEMDERIMAWQAELDKIKAATT